MPHGYPTPADPSKHSSVYFIQVGRDGPIKIGYASLNPYDRLFSLQTGNPLRLRMVGMIRPAEQTLEGEIHQRFAAHRLNGEWFRPVPQLLRYIAESTTLYSSQSYPETFTSKHRKWHFATPEQRAAMNEADRKAKRTTARSKLAQRILELQAESRIFRKEQKGGVHRRRGPRHP